jgi:predicted ribosomally synthesized peptide with SipW-like signal peptide
MTNEDDHYRLSRRNVLAGLGGIGLASAGAGVGTSALFSDEESFENNTITAGTLDLLVGYYSYWDQGMAGSGQVQGTQDGSGAISGTLTDVKPGDSGLLAFCPRIEDNPAYLWLCGEITENAENGYTDPEPDTEADGDINDPGTADGTGELADRIDVVVSYCDLDDDIADDGDDDSDNDGFDPSDVESATEVWSGTFAELMSAIGNGVPLDGEGKTPSEDGFFSPGGQACFDGTAAEELDNPCLCLDWEVPVEVGNEIQGDSLAFDLEFHAEQCRNNDGTHNPCADTDTECTECSFDTDATGDGASNLLSVGPDPDAGFPAIDARVRVDSALGNAGDLTASNFAVCEDGCGQTVDVAFESGGLVDIVVVFDDTGSMGGEISTMQSQVNTLTDNIENAGIDARYALVSFNDEAELDQDFTDASNFQAAVDDLSASGGADTPEDNLDALAVGTGNATAQDGEGASLSSFRSGAQRVVIDITDAPAQPKGDHTADYTDPDEATTRFSQSEIETLLNDGNVTYYAVSPGVDYFGGGDGVYKQNIAENVDDGTWIDIYDADFDDILSDIVGMITDPAYVLSYTTTNPSADGSSRTVDVQIDDPDEGLLYEEGSYTAPS